ncbi:MAG: (d)CMP kinase [Alphaproteobacteria bacterium]|nr:(d)CMP kinase [Alphaproteobacteria bacterium]
MKIIAIDGPAGAGKGTIARFLAEKLGYPHIDTGLFYRALALKVRETNTPHDQEDALAGLSGTLAMKDLQHPNIRDESVASVASIISVHPLVRAQITHKIRDLAYSLGTPQGGIILDGRDVGTVIFPHAAIKLFVTASPDARYVRRMTEMQKQNLSVPQDALTIRDQRDQTRTPAPLVPATDAVTIDTTDLSIQDACAKAYACVLG